MRLIIFSYPQDAQNWANNLETELGKVNQEHNLDYYTKLWLEECERVNGTEAIEEIQVVILFLI